MRLSHSVYANPEPCSASKSSISWPSTWQPSVQRSRCFQLTRQSKASRTCTAVMHYELASLSGCDQDVGQALQHTSRGNESTDLEGNYAAANNLDLLSCIILLSCNQSCTCMSRTGPMLKLGSCEVWLCIRFFLHAGLQEASSSASIMVHIYPGTPMAKSVCI